MSKSLFILQRLSALILAPLVLTHLWLILYATREELTAEAILARTQGNVGWALFYGLFVVAVAIHAPIGLRNILREWAPRLPYINQLTLAFGVVLFALGMRAVFAVIA
ncbi:MAG: succinate dehydrogenase [Pseudomonadota bacterium]